MPDAITDLRLVDATTLPEAWQAVLRPDHRRDGKDGKAHPLPRYFYQIPSWKTATEIQLAPGFHLWEFINVDLREAALQQGWPRYVPAAVTALATHLAVLREHVDTYVHVGANGGYRTPAHARNTDDHSLHCWGAAADIFRIGDDWLDDEATIARFTDVVRSVLPAVHVKPYEAGDDHLHLDLGYLTLVPQNAPTGTTHG